MVKKTKLGFAVTGTSYWWCLLSPYSRPSHSSFVAEQYASEQYRFDTSVWILQAVLASALIRRSAALHKWTCGARTTITPQEGEFVVKQLYLPLNTYHIALCLLYDPILVKIILLILVILCNWSKGDIKRTNVEHFLYVAQNLPWKLAHLFS